MENEEMEKMGLFFGETRNPKMGKATHLKYVSTSYCVLLEELVD
jgi:hypothetical protein